MNAKCKKFLTMLLLVCVSIGAAGCSAYSNQRYYERAQLMMGSGEYAEAAELFHQLGEYEDSAEYALYAAALDALQNSKIDLARANLLEIAPFKSADRYLRYLDALDAENEGELDSALDIYVSLGSFEDCAERAQTLEAAIPEQAIRQGRQMMSQGDYEGARDLFLSLNGYGQSRALSDACTAAIARKAYLAAEDLLGAGDYLGAMNAFAAMGDTLDAAHRAEECRSLLLKQAEEAFQAVTLETADALDEQLELLSADAAFAEIRQALAEKFGVDALRFFLMRTFPFGSDGNFSNELLISTINTDLANKLGNLVSRTTAMVEKYFGGKLPAAREDAPEDCDLKKTVCALRGRYEAEMDKLQLQNGLDEIFKVIDRANKYIDETAPWTLGKDESKHVRLATVLYNLLETIRVCTTLLMPVMPDTCEKIFAKIGAGAAARTWDNANVWGVLPTEAQVSKGENLFPRVDAEATLEKLNAMQKAQKKAALPAVEVEPFAQESVDFDTFCKSDLRAVKIKNCEPVKKSDKLLKFTLDDGSGTDRIILSGIHQYYEPEQLIGKTAIAILNLPPRKMMGIPSCGMLISAVHSEDGKEGLNLLMVDDRIPAGAKLY